MAGVAVRPVAIVVALGLSGVVGCGSVRPEDSQPQCPDTCDDGNVCTEDSCEEATGQCVNTAADAPCDDGNACSEKDLCSAGTCKAGGERSCDDGKLCTTDSCDATKGCLTSFNTVGCDDGDVCTEKDACSAGSCTGSNPRDCDDDNVCTDDSCDKANGCSNEPNTAGCDDGSKCSTDDACDLGLCIGGKLINCDDGNACTKDSCATATGCVNKLAAGSLCDDGDPCTTNDQCGDTGCEAGTAKICDDGDPCTVQEACKFGVCNGGVPNTCNDKDPCTIDSCKAFVGCQKVAASGPGCDDNNACTAKDTCSFGACVGAKVSCDDGNACTNDSCAPKTGCVNAANTNTCDDGDACSVGDACLAGSCRAGPPLGCKTCGNGAVDGLTVNAPTKCASTAATTISSKKDFDAWRVKANTPLTIDGTVDFGGSLLHIETPCAVVIKKAAKLTGIDSAFIAASKLTFDGGLQSKGMVIIRADTLTLSADAAIGGQAITNPTSIAIEANSAALAGPLTSSGELCVEANTVAFGSKSATGATLMTAAGPILVAGLKDVAVAARVNAGAAVTIRSKGALKAGQDTQFNGGKLIAFESGSDLVFGGSITDAGSLTFKAGQDLKLVAQSKIAALGSIKITAEATLQLAGSIDRKGQLTGLGKKLSMVTNAVILGSGGVDLKSSSVTSTLLVDGRIAGSKLVSVNGQSIKIGADAMIEKNDVVGIIGIDKVEVAGKILNNKSVIVKATEVTVTHGKALVGNTNCALQGAIGKNSAVSSCQSTKP